MPHDDLVNVAAGMIVMAQEGSIAPGFFFAGFSPRGWWPLAISQALKPREKEKAKQSVQYLRAIVRDGGTASHKSRSISLHSLRRRERQP